MTRYQAALNLIRAVDVYRTVSKAGQPTRVDMMSVQYAHYDYRKAK